MCKQILLGHSSGSQMCGALEHLQSVRLLHRDIKSDNNILLTVVNDMYHPMLIDSGKAVQLSDAPSKQKSLTVYKQEECRKKHQHIAPKIVLGQQPSFILDMFSLGLVMADVSGKVKMESLFLEGQRQYLQLDPKLRCSISYFHFQLKTNVHINQQ